MKTIVLLALTLTAAFAQTVVTPANVTFSNDAVAALNAFFVTQITSSPVKLAAPMAPGDLAMTVNDGTKIAVNQEFLIDTEAVNPSAIVGNVVTITRGDLGTVAGTHQGGTPVNVLKYKSLRNFCKQVVADAVTGIMSGTSYPTGATQDAIIAAALAAKAAAQAAAIQ